MVSAKIAWLVVCLPYGSVKLSELNDRVQRHLGQEASDCNFLLVCILPYALTRHTHTSLDGTAPCQRTRDVSRSKDIAANRIWGGYVQRCNLGALYIRVNEFYALVRTHFRVHHAPVSSSPSNNHTHRIQKSLFVCPHHSCSVCGRTSQSAGGLLMSCTECMKSFCEDHEVVVQWCYCVYLL